MDPAKDQVNLPMTKVAQRSAVVTIVMTVLSLFFVGSKIFTRARVQGRLGWDDALVATSFLFTIPFCVTVIGQAENGQGRSMKELTLPMLGRQLKWLWASMIVYVLGTGLAKLSILCQYLRVFIGKKTTLATWVAIIFVSAYTVQATFVGIFSCVPVEKYWDRAAPGYCIEGPVYYYFAAAMNMVTDIFVFIIPIPALLRLNISNHNKYGMIIAFSFGSIGCIVSAMRLYLISQVSGSPDLSKTSADPAMWTAVELHLCVMCACLPSLRPLLSRVFSFVAGGRPATAGGTAATAAHHQKRMPFVTWSRGEHGRLDSASVASGRGGYGARTGSGGTVEEGEAKEVEGVGARRSDVEEREAGGERVELSELEGIKVTSTSEVYSIRAESGRRSSAQSESRLTRGQGQDPWGYTCEVKCQGPS